MAELPKSVNKILVLTNNVMLIGGVVENSSNDGVLISKPHAIKLVPTGEFDGQGKPGMAYELTPFLQEFTGQEWSEMPLQNIHILTSAKADKNDMLHSYLQLISGIDLTPQKIIM